MTYDPLKHHRRSIRLPGYDYAQPGAYFITICVHASPDLRERSCLLGEITNDVMQLNAWGEIVRETWFQLPMHYPYIALDMFVIMPNHVHGIIIIGDGPGVGATVGAGLRPAPTVSVTSVTPTTPAVSRTRHGLPEIVRAFKSFSARHINELRASPGVPVWQRNYYEHIVRDEADLARIRAYIQNNPAQWALDQLHPGVPKEIA